MQPGLDMDPSRPRIGRYEVLRKIATGGMAELFLAKQVGMEGFEKVVALKRILSHLAFDEEFIAMFRDEARIVAKLSHPNIVQIYDLGKSGDSYFIAMEYIPGRNLSAIAKKSRAVGRPLPPTYVARCLAQACEGLYYAHTQKDIDGQELQIIHRDVSPQNIIVSFSGSVKLVDFGIAKAASKMAHTRAGVLKGKYAYMSPEQIRGEPIDPRSDLFSVGIVLYELLCGRRPFEKENSIQTLKAIVQDAPIPCQSINPEIPDALAAIIDRCLAKDRSRRYGSAQEVQIALEDVVSTSGERCNNITISSWLCDLFEEELTREAGGTVVFQGVGEVILPGLPESPDVEPLSSRGGRRPPIEAPSNSLSPSPGKGRAELIEEAPLRRTGDRTGRRIEKPTSDAKTVYTGQASKVARGDADGRRAAGPPYDDDDTACLSPAVPSRSVDAGVDRPTDWEGDRPTDWEGDRPTDWEGGRPTDWETERPTEWEGEPSLEDRSISILVELDGFASLEAEDPHQTPPIPRRTGQPEASVPSTSALRDDSSEAQSLDRATDALGPDGPEAWPSGRTSWALDEEEAGEPGEGEALRRALVGRVDSDPGAPAEEPEAGDATIAMPPIPGDEDRDESRDSLAPGTTGDPEDRTLVPDGEAEEAEDAFAAEATLAMPPADRPNEDDPEGDRTLGTEELAALLANVSGKGSASAPSPDVPPADEDPFDGPHFDGPTLGEAEDETSMEAQDRTTAEPIPARGVGSRRAAPAEAAEPMAARDHGPRRAAPADPWDDEGERTVRGFDDAPAAPATTRSPPLTLRDRALTEGALTEGALTEGALTEGALTEGDQGASLRRRRLSPSEPRASVPAAKRSSPARSATTTSGPDPFSSAAGAPSTRRSPSPLEAGVDIVLERPRLGGAERAPAAYADDRTLAGVTSDLVEAGIPPPSDKTYDPLPDPEPDLVAAFPAPRSPPSLSAVAAGPREPRPGPKAMTEPSRPEGDGPRPFAEAASPPTDALGSGGRLSRDSSPQEEYSALVAPAARPSAGARGRASPSSLSPYPDGVGSLGVAPASGGFGSTNVPPASLSLSQVLAHPMDGSSLAKGVAAAPPSAQGSRLQAIPRPEVVGMRATPSRSTSLIGRQIREVVRSDWAPAGAARPPEDLQVPSPAPVNPLAFELRGYESLVPPPPRRPRSVARRVLTWVVMALSVLGLATATFFLLPYVLPEEPRLTIRTVPEGARVRVNGAMQTGRTPLTISGLIPGVAYQVELELAGHQTVEQDVTLPPDRPLIWQIRLEPAGAAQ